MPWRGRRRLSHTPPSWTWTLLTIEGAHHRRYCCFALSSRPEHHLLLSLPSCQWQGLSSSVNEISKGAHHQPRRSSTFRRSPLYLLNLWTSPGTVIDDLFVDRMQSKRKEGKGPPFLPSLSINLAVRHYSRPQRLAGHRQLRPTPLPTSTSSQLKPTEKEGGTGLHEISLMALQTSSSWFPTTPATTEIQQHLIVVNRHLLPPRDIEATATTARSDSHCN